MDDIFGSAYGELIGGVVQFRGFQRERGVDLGKLNQFGKTGEGGDGRDTKVNLDNKRPQDGRENINPTSHNLAEERRDEIVRVPTQQATPMATL